MRKTIGYCLLVAFSCSSPQKNDAWGDLGEHVTVLEIDPHKAQRVSFLDLFEEIEVIPLETKDDHLVSRIGKMEYFDKKYFVLTAGMVIVFDEGGKILSKIDKKGVGPEEYQSVWDMYIDRSNRTIELLEPPAAKILTFDFGGNLADIWRYGLIVESFTKMDEDTYVFYSGNHFNDGISEKLLVKSKSTGEVIESYLPIDENDTGFLHFLNNRRLSKNEEGLSVLETFENTIHQLADGDITPRYVIDFGSSNLPAEFLDKPFEHSMDFVQQARSNRYAFLINSLFEDEGYLFFAYEFGDEAQFVVYNKNDKSILLVDELFDDLFFEGGAKVSDIREFVPLAQKDGKLIIAIEPAAVLGRLAEATVNPVINSSDNLDISGIIHSLESSDNPLLLVCKFKS